MREHRVPIYDSEIGHTFTIEEDDVVFEGRKELYTVLKALRNYGSPDACKLAKELWLLHTGLCKCDCCGRLTKELRYNSLVDARGYRGVCRECDKSFYEEYRKTRQGGLGK